MPHTYDDPCGLAHARMTQQAYACARGLIAHAQRAFARSLWPLVSRVVCNMCAMDNVLIVSYSCQAILRAYELSARAAGATACMRVRVWPHGARGFARIPLNVLRVACVRVAMYLRVRCVCATGVFLPPYNLLGMNTWILGCAACRELVCAHACVCVVSLSAKGMMQSCSSMPIKCPRERALCTCDV